MNGAESLRSHWLILGSTFNRTSPQKVNLHHAPHTTMASLPRRLLLQSRQCPSRIRSRVTPKHSTQWQRPISSTPRRRADDDTPSPASEPHKRTPKPTPEETAASQLARLVADLKALDPDMVDDAIRKGQQGIPFATDVELVKDDDMEIAEDDKRKIAAGFWAEGEEEMGPDEDYYGDDITSHGHGELQQHRELREYSRLIAWEMPLLSREYILSLAWDGIHLY